MEPLVTLVTNYSLASGSSTVVTVDMGLQLWPYLNATFLCNAFNENSSTPDDSPRIQSGLSLSPFGHTIPFDCRDYLPSPPPPPLPPDAPLPVIVDPERCSLRWIFFLNMVLTLLTFISILVSAVFIWCDSPHHPMHPVLSHPIPPSILSYLPIIC